MGEEAFEVELDVREDAVDLKGGGKGRRAGGKGRRAGGGEGHRRRS